MNEDAMQRRPMTLLLAVLGVAALIAGLYGRFKGLGTWSLGVDEFYISRSIDNVLRSGLPAFPCGGYYTRGLIFQYAVAALRLLGFSPEFAGRVTAASASLAVLPAAYLIGKQVRSPTVGWLVVMMLCVSIWQIEMARFARMYAPFQAVFVWYVVHYLRYTVEKRAAALRWMIGLSVLGVLTWEGGALLGIANLVAVLVTHEGGRIKGADWLRLALLSALLMLLVLSTHDLRGFAEAPESGAVQQVQATLPWAAVWLSPLWRHPLWALGLLVPFALTCWAFIWIASFRDRWLAAVGLAVVLAAAALHAFLIAGSVLALLWLVRLVTPAEMQWRNARSFWLALSAFFVFWSVCAARGALGPGPMGVPLFLFGFPDTYDEMLRPWGRALPILSAGIFATILYSAWRSIADKSMGIDGAASLLSLILVLALAVGANATDRIETRYTFFLYPALMVLAVNALCLFIRRHSRGHVAVLTVTVPLLCFGATEDFQPRHLLAIDTAKISFRVGMSAVRAAHYYPRSDMRAEGRWLTEQVGPGDVVITGIPNLDQYYHRIDYFYLAENDSRYETYVCRDGSTERWTNHPVLYTLNSLKPIVDSGHRVFASLYAIDEKRLAEYAASAGWSVTPVWRSDSLNADLLLITARPSVGQ